MSRKIDKTTIPFLENAGYGKGTNFSIDLVASLMQQYADSVVKNINYDTVLPTVTFMQLCPKCNGQGTVSKPPYVAGDVHEWTSSATSFVCDVCNGTKIIPATCNGG